MSHRNRGAATREWAVLPDIPDTTTDGEGMRVREYALSYDIEEGPPNPRCAAKSRDQGK